MTHASLFSGIGGAEIAATQMGWSNLFHCEINPFGRRVLEYWYPNSTSYEDITQTDFAPWRGRIDVLTAGFPCQPFSLAGSRKGADDDRYLWPQVVRAIREIRPAWFVGENVAGILTMVQPGTEVEVGGGASLFGEDYRKRVLLRQQFTVETICASLEREGYSVQPLVIPACAVGAPHRRDRVWFIARRVAPNATGHGNSGRPGQLCTQDGRPQERVYAQPVKHGGVPSGPASFPDRELLSNWNGKGHEGWKDKRQLFEPQGCQGLWETFPTQSPVCSGDDGIPCRLAGITFPKWRAESIKALGNAWVPQVAYEIFRAIQQVEDEASTSQTTP